MICSVVVVLSAPARAAVWLAPSLLSPCPPPTPSGHHRDNCQAPNDVYVYEPTPLKEGEEKHVISVFVADEAGLINRVAGAAGAALLLRGGHGARPCLLIPWLWGCAPAINHVTLVAPHTLPSLFPSLQACLPGAAPTLSPLPWG